MKKITKSLAETKATARVFMKNLKPREKAVVVGLFGDLGSGKTSFVQGVAEALGIAERVISPTFILEKIYKLGKGPFSHLIHIDAYRLENEKEAHVLGWDVIIQEPGNIIMVEWADKIETLLPKDTERVYFSFIDDTQREIQWQ